VSAPQQLIGAQEDVFPSLVTSFFRLRGVGMYEDHRGQERCFSFSDDLVYLLSHLALCRLVRRCPLFFLAPIL